MRNPPWLVTSAWVPPYYSLRGPHETHPPHVRLIRLRARRVRTIIVQSKPKPSIMPGVDVEIKSEKVSVLCPSSMVRRPYRKWGGWLQASPVP